MGKPALSRRIAGGINAACLILILLATSILSPAFMRSFYEYEFEKNDTYNTVRMEKEDLMEVTLHMLDYMKDKEANLNIETKINGEERLFFSEREIMHMKDVKDLIGLCFAVRYAAAVLFVLSLGFLVVGKSGENDWKKYIFRSWKHASLGIFISFAALGALICLNFNRAFTVFHEIFFSNDLWLLDERVDLLVNIVPLPFFIDIAVYVGALFVFFLCAMFTVGAVVSKKLSK